MLERDKALALVFVSLVLVVSVLAATDICNQGCEENTGECSDPGRPFLCERSVWLDKCVPKGYDFGACGGASDNGGYCSECDEGCVLGDGCSGSTPYKCKKAWAFDECVVEGYDFGCCGGINPSEDNRQIVLKAYITNNDPECTDEDGYAIEWTVRRRGEANFVDYSDKCDEGNYKDELIHLDLGESVGPLTCRDKTIPWKDTGPHTARVSWCTHSNETVYGAPPSSGKYCVVNVSRDGDDINELNIDTFIITLIYRMNEIRTGKRGAATLGAYDPMWTGQHSLVPLEDLKPVRECMAKCQDCAAVLNLEEDVVGVNENCPECVGLAGWSGAYSGAVFLTAAAVSGDGIKTSSDAVSYHEEYYRNTGIEGKKGLKIPESVGDDMLDKGYYGDKAVSYLETEINSLKAKYGLTYESKLETQHKMSQKMIEDFQNKKSEIVEAMNKNIRLNGWIKKYIPEADLKNIFTDADAMTVVNSFYDEGWMHNLEVDAKVAKKLRDYANANIKPKLTPSELEFFTKKVLPVWDHMPSNVFGEALVNDISLFHGSPLKKFIASNSFAPDALIDHHIHVIYTDLGGNIGGLAYEDRIKLNSKANRYLSNTNMFHEIGHTIGMNSGAPTDIPGYPPALDEVMATKAETEFFQKMNELNPNKCYDLGEAMTRHKLHTIDPVYGRSLAFWDYFKRDSKYGFDIIKDKTIDFYNMKTTEAVLKITSIWSGITSSSIGKAIRAGSTTLSSKLRFDEVKKTYIWIGDGMTGVKGYIKVAGKTFVKGIGFVLGVDNKVGGLWAVYEAAQNPLTRKRVKISHFNDPVVCEENTCDAACGTMVISHDDEGVYKKVTDFTIKKGYLWDVYLGSQRGDLLNPSVCEELGLVGMGIEIKPSYMDCTDAGDGILNCVENEEGLEFTDSGELFPVDGDTGYVLTEVLEDAVEE